MTINRPWNISNSSPQFCDRSKPFQQYYFGCYNLLRVKLTYYKYCSTLYPKVTGSGSVQLSFEISKGKSTFPPKLVTSCVFILEQYEEQYKEWAHPSVMADKFLSYNLEDRPDKSAMKIPHPLKTN